MAKKSKLRVGVVFQGNPLAGGGFHDGLSATLLVSQIGGNCEFIYYAMNKENARVAQECGLVVRLIHFGKIQRLIHRMRSNIRLNHWFDKLKIFAPLDKVFETDGISIVYFTGPNPLALFLERLNYILPVWDLCHRDHPEFPEVRDKFEFDARESFLKSALPKASAVIAESPFGRESLIRRYGLDSEKVFYVWKPPSTRILQLASEDIGFNPKTFAKIPSKADYIFYPSQFWAHKNHKLIVESIHHLKNSHGLEIYAIFCGSDCGNLQPILEYSRELKVDELIKYVGFAPDKQIPHYYKNSLALVMPSFFGPTNMPPVEAFVLGTPVVVANLPGFKDQVGDAGILVDPYDPVSLSDAILSLVNSDSYRRELINRGKNRALIFSDEQRLITLRKIFENFAKKLSLWQFD